MKLRVAHVTTCRSDYGPCYWLLHEMFANKRLEVTLLVAGSHLSRRKGNTVAEINQHKWPRVRRIPFLCGSDNTADLSGSCARALKAFGEYFAQEKPDILSLYGDRIELLPIATAAVIHGVPIAHTCGGDVTQGAFDDQVRHAITKMAHLHFPSTKGSAARIKQMGEEPWRIHNTGDPALDHFALGNRASKEELQAYLGIPIGNYTLLVTLHPETLAPHRNPNMVDEVLIALEKWPGSIVITAPAPDPGSEIICKKLRKFSGKKDKAVFVENLGGYRYRGLLFHVCAVVGNSSSGLTEAAAVPVPSVNIGDRQKGRERGKNVIDVSPCSKSILKGLRKAASATFRQSLAGMRNAYGNGNASRNIVKIMLAAPEKSILLNKRFFH